MLVTFDPAGEFVFELEVPCLFEGMHVKRDGMVYRVSQVCLEVETRPGHYHPVSGNWIGTRTHEAVGVIRAYVQSRGSDN
jgi:hypothetical protein